MKNCGWRGGTLRCTRSGEKIEGGNGERNVQRPSYNRRTGDCDKEKTPFRILENSTKGLPELAPMSKTGQNACTWNNLQNVLSTATAIRNR